MQGTVAITDHGWYEFLFDRQEQRLKTVGGTLDEVNFWRPSAHWSFNGEPGSPFFFKLKKKYDNAICGHGVFVKYTAVPDYTAWDFFGEMNGTESFQALRVRLSGIRKHINYRGSGPVETIGCILIAQPMFFSPAEWVRGPEDWPSNNLVPKRYSIESGEGARIWKECMMRSPGISKSQGRGLSTDNQVAPDRFGAPQLINPRLGQGIFRAQVLDAYGRACAITTEHSLPALDASHIKPFSDDGPHEVRNGILLRADLHRLFDSGYITITNELKIEVSPALKHDFSNGKSYYPLHGQTIQTPEDQSLAPSRMYIEWHNENVWKAA